MSAADLIHSATTQFERLQKTVKDVAAEEFAVRKWFHTIDRLHHIKRDIAALEETLWKLENGEHNGT